MKVLTVRLDDDLHARIKASAEQDARSLNGQITWLLKAGLDASNLPPASVAAEIREGLAAAERGETEDLGSFAQRPRKTVVGYSKEQQARGRKP